MTVILDASTNKNVISAFVKLWERKRENGKGRELEQNFTSTKCEKDQGVDNRNIILKIY